MKKVILGIVFMIGTVLSAGLVEDTTVGVVGYQRADAQIEVANGGGNGHALLAITQLKNPGDTSDEAAISYGAFDSLGAMKQTASISSMWSNNATSANGYAVLRFNVDTVAGGSDIAMRIFANQGVSFWGGSDTVSPGGKFISITRSGGYPSISGTSDLVLEGANGSSGTVFINAYNSGDISLNLGGGKTVINGFLKINSNVGGCPASTTATRCLKVIDVDGAYSYVPLFR